MTRIALVVSAFAAICCVVPAPSATAALVLELRGTICRRYEDLEVAERGRIRLPGVGVLVEGMNGCVLVDETRGMANLRMFETAGCSISEDRGVICVDAPELISQGEEHVSIQGCFRYRPRPLG